MSLVKQISGKEEIERAATVLAEAFSLDDPLFTYLFPTRRNKIARTTALFSYLLTLGIAEGEVFCTKKENGAGAAIIYKPESSYGALFPQIRAGIIKAVFQIGMGAALRALRYDEFALKKHKALMPHDHIYLYSIGVSPRFQGQGLAGHLLSHIISISQKEELPIYLETSAEANIMLYEHFGFRVIEKSHIPGSDIDMWSMIRDYK